MHKFHLCPLPYLPLPLWVLLHNALAYREARNTSPLPEIIFDLSLVLSLHVALLSLILANEVFLVPNLTSTKKIS